MPPDGTSSLDSLPLSLRCRWMLGGVANKCVSFMQPFNPEEVFDKQERIGKGSFGNVYKGCV